MVVISRQKSHYAHAHPGGLRRQNSSAHDLAEAGREHERYSRDWWRVGIWKFLEHPASSAAAFYWMCGNLSIITISSAAFVLETLPPLCCGRYQSVFGTIEPICVTFFTAEYLLRLATAPGVSRGQLLVPAAGGADDDAPPPQPARDFTYLTSRLRFAASPMNLIDLLAILPLYVELVVTSGNAFLRYVSVR
jgi:hypothetical protein